VRPVAALRPRLHAAGEAGPQEAGAVSRRNFVELCERWSDETEVLYESLWRRLGLSVDWTQKYTTISPSSIAAAQRGFLRNLARGEAYQAEAPGSGT
jgi:valyl-tRNA synthetase